MRRMFTVTAAILILGCAPEPTQSEIPAPPLGETQVHVVTGDGETVVLHETSDWGWHYDNGERTYQLNHGVSGVLMVESVASVIITPGVNPPEGVTFTHFDSVRLAPQSLDGQAIPQEDSNKMVWDFGGEVSHGIFGVNSADGDLRRMILVGITPREAGSLIQRASRASQGPIQQMINAQVEQMVENQIHNKISTARADMRALAVALESYFIDQQ